MEGLGGICPQAQGKTASHGKGKGGRHLHRGEWDLAKLIALIPGEQAFRLCRKVSAHWFTINRQWA